MPEAPAWKFRKIIKPLFDLQKENIIFKCRVIETKSLTVIENGFVEIDNGKIIKVGSQSDLDSNLNSKKVLFCWSYNFTWAYELSCPSTLMERMI